jgi:hypothetical protein
MYLLRPKLQPHPLAQEKLPLHRQLWYQLRPLPQLVQSLRLLLLL